MSAARAAYLLGVAQRAAAWVNPAWSTAPVPATAALDAFFASDRGERALAAGVAALSDFEQQRRMRG